jgi:hypothetical protein
MTENSIDVVLSEAESLLRELYAALGEEPPAFDAAKVKALLTDDDETPGEG